MDREDRRSEGGSSTVGGASVAGVSPALQVNSQAYAAAALGNILLSHSASEPWAMGKGVVTALSQLLQAPLSGLQVQPKETDIVQLLSVAMSAAGALQNFVATVMEGGRGGGNPGSDMGDWMDALEGVVTLISGAEQIHQVCMGGGSLM